MPYPLPERNKKISTLIKWFVERKKGKVVAAIKSGKIKTACMMTGITCFLPRAKDIGVPQICSIGTMSRVKSFLSTCMHRL